MAREIGLMRDGGFEQDIEPADHVVIDNQTGLPDVAVEAAVKDHFVENASMAWGHQTSFQTYAAEGSLLARRQFLTPTNILDEIKLARELAEKDDDIAGVLGQMLALAFGEGMENQHADEKTVALFNKIAENANLDGAFQEMYRELLISSQVNSAALFTRETLEYTLDGSDKVLEESVAAPLIGVLPAEQIRVLGNDTFGTGILAFEPDNERLRRWLDEYFSESTTPARKAEMGRQDRVSANMFTGVHEVSASEALDTNELPVTGGKLYILNPKMVKRTTFPKGTWKYPRPLLTRNFALLEAKRLLNIMDYALLQGGSSYIVVAKKGDKDRPAQPEEITNLQQVVRRASKTGIIVGDHRLSFDIITPELKEMLNPAKRRLIGRKLAMAMLRLSEHGDEEGGSEGIKSDDEMTARVIMSDRRIVVRQVESHVYGETVSRNKQLFPKGAPSIWTPKIILRGSDMFTDYILKLRDRGDIPRAWAVAAAGFNWTAAVEERKREVARGDDEVMQPGSVPHSSPEAGPQDNNPGRTPGGTDPAAPRRRLGQNQGETVTAWYEDEVAQVVRMGETTRTILEQFPERNIGRVTTIEREMLDERIEEAVQRGATYYMPVNPEYETTDEKAVRLAHGLSMLIGSRADGALVAKMLCFRDSAFTKNEAEDTTARWGFPLNARREVPIDDAGLPDAVDIPALMSSFAALASASAGRGEQAINLNLELSGGGAVRRLILRGEDGEIIGSEEVPVPEAG